jgi:hypothetical protein
MASPEVPIDDGEKSFTNEKVATENADGDLEHRGEIANLPPDPDGHLSAEERALIVRSLDAAFLVP